MIQLHSWHTANGRKVSIALEELGLASRVVPVDFTRGAQHEPSFLAVNPNGKFRRSSITTPAGRHLHLTHHRPDASAYAQTRFADEARRLYGVLEQRLGDHGHLADEYSVADIAVWPWIARHPWQRSDLNAYPAVRRWYVAIAGRPAGQRGWRVPQNDQDIPMPQAGRAA